MSRAELLEQAKRFGELARYCATPSWAAIYSARAELAAWHASRARA